MLTELVVTLVIFTLTQIVGFIVFVIRFNTKFQVWKTQSALEIEGIKAMISESQKTWDSEMIELKTDIEDHKLSFNRKFERFSDDFKKTYSEGHRDIIQDIGVIKETTSKIRESLGELRGAFDIHITSDGAIKALPKKRRT